MSTFDPEAPAWIKSGLVICEGVSTEEEATPLRALVSDQEQLLGEILARNHAILVEEGVAEKVGFLDQARSIHSAHQHDPARGRVLAQIYAEAPDRLRETSQEYDLLQQVESELGHLETEFEEIDAEVEERFGEDPEVDDGEIDNPIDWLVHASDTGLPSIQFRVAENVEEADPLGQRSPRKLYVVIYDRKDGQAGRDHSLTDVGTIEYDKDGKDKLVVPYTPVVPSALYLTEDDLKVVEACADRVIRPWQEGLLPNLVTSGYNDRLWVQAPELADAA